MEKKRVSVQIEGRSYSLITTDDEKYVQKVANEVLSHIRKAAQSTKQLDTRDCAVLAALNFCDDRNKALKKNKDYVEKADKIIQQTNAELAGVGILIEKSFQSGHDYIVNKGYDFYSLANITSFDDGKITFAE